LEKEFLVVSGRTVVPEELVPEIIAAYHENKFYGHLGATKMKNLLRQHYVFWDQSRSIDRYISRCVICQACKAPNARPSGELHPLPLPVQKWSDLAMDWITHLPTTSSGNNCIWTIIDVATKMAHFIPCNLDQKASQLAQVFLDTIIRLHGTPKSIVSDRDPKLTSNFWTEFTRLFDIRKRMTVSHRAQGDGQSEVANRTVVNFLKVLTVKFPTDWDLNLSYAEIQYNNQESASTGFSPYFLMYGYHPTFPLELPDRPDTQPQLESLKQFLKRMRVIRELAFDHLATARERSVRSYNSRHRPVPQWAPGDWVWVHVAKMMRIEKLAPRWAGPYQILNKVGLMNYLLDFSGRIKTHPVFNVDSLKKYSGKFSQGRPASYFPWPSEISIMSPKEARIVHVLSRRPNQDRTGYEYQVVWTEPGQPDTLKFIPRHELCNRRGEPFKLLREHENSLIAPALSGV
jgi:hypothetical protein